jgi:hypothetical protein
VAAEYLDLEGGTDDLLLETGDKLLLESSTAAAAVLLLRLLAEGLFVGDETGMTA